MSADSMLSPEQQSEIVLDILTAAVNLETVAGNSDGSAMDELAASRIRARAARLRAFARKLEAETAAAHSSSSRSQR